MKNNGVSLALIGASGVVGTKIIKLLEKRAFPVSQFIPLGLSTVGSIIQFKGADYSVASLDTFKPEEAQLIIFSAGSDVAEEYARGFVTAGSYVIDLSSEFRYEDDVPLIIPEINGDILINATPIGMAETYNECLVSENTIRNFKYIIDLNYNPSINKLLYLASKNQIVNTNGLTMLIFQAVKAFEIWNNKKVSYKNVNKLIKFINVNFLKQITS